MTEHQQQINVIKRDGTSVRFDLSKWQAHIAKICDGIANVSPSMIEIESKAQFVDGMTTTELDNIALKAMINLIDEEERPDIGDVNYQYAAGKQFNVMMRKQVYGTHEIPHLYEIVKKNVEAKVYTSELLDWYTEDEWNTINKFVDHTKDEDMAISQLEQLADKYLIKNRDTGVLFETPQIRYIIAAVTAFSQENKKNRLKYIKEYYNHASDGDFTLSTPVLGGLGTKTKQFSSCTVIRVNDNIDSIFAAGEMMGKYAAKRAGIGFEFGRIRPLGSKIRNGEVKHTGLVPFLKKWYGDLRCVSQGGTRNSSATFTYPIWHYQFDDLIQLKNNRGIDETRVRHLDYSVVVSKFFLQRLIDKANITLFDPNEVPELYELYYRDIQAFEKLYVKCEARKDIKKKVFSAETIFKDWLLKERIETGRIYIIFIDNVQAQSAFNPLTHPVYSSNLCQEIFLATQPFDSIEDPTGRIALCTLGSQNWGNFKRPEDMRSSIRYLVRSLDNLLSYQDFLSIQSSLSNDEFRPLGIGITNLAYWHAKRGLKYGEPEALAEVKRWIEHQTFYAIEASMELAIERGACGLSSTTSYGRGIFPWESKSLSNVKAELVDLTPELDWESLRQKLLVHGIRNATLAANPPVESSSVCVNSTNGCEMVKELIISKTSGGNTITQVVPEYKKLKNKYQKMWDQPDCYGYLKTWAVIQSHTDQGSSANTFASARNYQTDDKNTNGKISVTDMINLILTAYAWGFKSLYYHITDKQAAIETKEDVLVESVDEETEEYCEACVL